ncbi:MAG: hypothetical protein ABI164_00250 [Acidobacteriaceae bacterium]
MAVTTSTNDVESNISDRVSDTVEQAKGKLTEFGAAAADKFDQNRSAAANNLEGAADTLHQRADQLPGGERVADIAHSAADKLSATADYVRLNDFSGMMEDVQGLVKKNPGPALIAAAALGFLLARAISGDSRG